MPRISLRHLIYLAVCGATVAFLYLPSVSYYSKPRNMAPGGKKPWADGPLKMVTTPLFLAKQTSGSVPTDTFTTGASHMAVLHNAMLRGYNSIYLQAPHVKPEDYADFIGYCLTWFKFVKGHHDDEEANLFPKVAEVLGKEDKEVWGKTHGEHEAMLPGLAKFNDYLTTLSDPSEFKASSLLSIMKEFEEPFDTHFHSEIASIAAMSSYGDFPAASPVFAAWGKNSVKSAGYTDVVPFLFLNFDRTVEDGLWATWPPMPAPIRYMLVRVGGWWHGNWWKFASCDADGMPKELYAVEDKAEGESKI